MRIKGPDYKVSRIHSTASKLAAKRAALKANYNNTTMNLLICARNATRFLKVMRNEHATIYGWNLGTGTGIRKKANSVSWI